MISETPASLGYCMPAEWERHTATWLAWPHNRDTWPHRLEQVQTLYMQMIAALEPHETVNLLVNDAVTASRISQLLRTGTTSFGPLPPVHPVQDMMSRNLTSRGLSTSGLRLHQCPTVDAWLRDSGPIFLTATSPPAQPPALVDWRFNAWGEKYPEMLPDDGLPQRIAAILGLRCFQPGIVLEGGSIDVNGRGSCLTTEQCLLNPNRNLHLGRTDIERYLHDYLGLHHIIWLGEGIAGDDTDGHIDDLARFVNPTTVVCVTTDDPQDINYAALQDNYRRLQTATDQDGHALRVVPLPMPDPVRADNDALPASYANFYIANHTVLVPTYNCPQDQVALAVLQELFPERRVLGLPCEPLVWGLGAIHCITQQQPATGPASA